MHANDIAIIIPVLDDARSLRDLLHAIRSWTSQPTEIIVATGSEDTEIADLSREHHCRRLGCEPCTNPIDSTASNIDEVVEELKTTKIAERSGRAQDKESSFTMQKLRALGYM